MFFFSVIILSLTTPHIKSPTFSPGVDTYLAWNETFWYLLSNNLYCAFWQNPMKESFSLGGGWGGEGITLHWGKTLLYFLRFPCPAWMQTRMFFLVKIGNDRKWFICIQINMKAKDCGRRAPSAALSTLQMVRRWGSVILLHRNSSGSH